MPADIDFCYREFLLAIEPFWGITRLSLTLPWDLDLRRWSQLFQIIYAAFPNVAEIRIDRPNVNYLLPQVVGIHCPFRIEENSFRDYWDHAIASHLLGFKYPKIIAKSLWRPYARSNGTTKWKCRLVTRRSG